MDLRDYLRIWRRNWMVVAAIALVGLLAGGAASVLIRPIYTAQSQLFVAIQSSGSVSELQQGNTFSQARVQSYVKTVATPVVLQPAIEALGLHTTAADLATRVSASSDTNTVIIKIAVADGSPVQAAAIAEAVSNSLIRAVDALEKPKTGGQSPVSLSVISPAEAPLTASAPNATLNLLVGLILGMAVGSATAILRSVLDTRVRSEADFRQVTDAPLLGGIAFDAVATKAPLLTQTDSQGPRAESFRQLRTNLQFANVSGHANSVLVTSSLPGEGKSTTATNLALALARAGQTVCLVDADLRRPMVHEYLGLDRNAGLTTSLVGAADINDLIQPWGDDGLFVVTSGQIPPNPSELLGSLQMKELVQRLELAFDTVIIDAPPLLPVTDAAVLSQHVGGVVLVIGTHTLRRPDLERSLAALQMVEADLLGVVLNQLPPKGADAYSYSYTSYRSEDYVGDGSSGKGSQRRALPDDRRDRGTPELRLESEFESEATHIDPRPARTFPRSHNMR